MIKLGREIQLYYFIHLRKTHVVLEQMLDDEKNYHLGYYRFHFIWQE